MKKILVIGCPGSGKSTFARKLRDVTGLPLYYLDMIYHNPDKTTVSQEAFDMRLKEILKTDSWIIDGNYNRTLKKRIKKCDTVYLLDFPLETCLTGVESRIGKTREDMPWVETEFDEEFREWIIGFAKDKLPYIYKILKRYRRRRRIIVFKSREDVDNYISTLQNLKSLKYLST